MYCSCTMFKWLKANSVNKDQWMAVCTFWEYHEKNPDLSQTCSANLNSRKGLNFSLGQDIPHCRIIRAWATISSCRRQPQVSILIQGTYLSFQTNWDLPTNCKGQSVTVALLNADDHILLFGLYKVCIATTLLEIAINFCLDENNFYWGCCQNRPINLHYRNPAGTGTIINSTTGTRIGGADTVGPVIYLLLPPQTQSGSSDKIRNRTRSLPQMFKM